MHHTTNTINILPYFFTHKEAKPKIRPNLSNFNMIVIINQHQRFLTIATIPQPERWFHHIFSHRKKLSQKLDVILRVSKLLWLFKHAWMGTRMHQSPLHPKENGEKKRKTWHPTFEIQLVMLINQCPNKENMRVEPQNKQIKYILRIKPLALWNQKRLVSFLGEDDP